jgi:hypothetical protein
VIFVKVWVAIVAAIMNEVSIGIGFELYTYSIDRLDGRSDILPKIIFGKNASHLAQRPGQIESGLASLY